MMQVLDALRYVLQRLETVWNGEDEEVSIYDVVNTLITELKTVIKICGTLTEYEQSDVIDAYLGKNGGNE